MGYHVKKAVNFSVRLYIGSRERRDGPHISAEQIKQAIQQYQFSLGLEKATPVRLTPTTYLWQEYEEDGWEIGMINYPRRPLGPLTIHAFAMDLAAYLLTVFNQNRISIEFPDETCMLEADDAEQ